MSTEHALQPESDLQTMRTSSQQAILLFARFLAEFPSGSVEELESWIESQPDPTEHADQLRRIHAANEALGGGRSPGTGSPRGANHLFFAGGTHPPPELVTDLEAGIVVGDYRLVEPLGSGGMGQVWVAEQVSLGCRRVALKFVDPRRVTGRTLAFFEREARAGSRLGHHGIVAVHAAGDTDGRAWIAMELVEGGRNLRDFLDEMIQAPEVPEGYDRAVAEFVAEVADAMQAAHEAGVLHRDLKPRNILVTREDRPKVTDFGLARITGEDSLSITGDVLGTYFYMSPEQVLADKSAIDHRTDVFSLGVVLYELLSLKRPFEGDTTHQVAEQILTKDPPDPRAARSRVPNDLSVITAKAMEKQPGRRYRAMRELAADLRRFLGDEPIHARSPGPHERALKWIRRNPAVSSAGAVGLVALIVVSMLAAANGRLARLKVRQSAALEAQVRIAEAARAQADRERARADTERAAVVRLSAKGLAAELTERQKSLWPPHPDQIADLRTWLADAQRLLADLGVYRSEREELRSRAVPRTEDERLADRRTHVRYPEFLALERELESKRRALRVRTGEAQPVLPALEEENLPEDRRNWSEAAWRKLAPIREEFGSEALGVAMLLAVVDELRGEEQAKAYHYLSFGWHALGADEEALAAGERAVALASGDALDFVSGNYRTTREMIERARSERGIQEALAEITRLEEDVSVLGELIQEREVWEFLPEDDQVAGRHERLSQLVRALETLDRELVDPGVTTEAHGWSVGKRLRFAEDLERDSSGSSGGAWVRISEELGLVGSPPEGLPGLVPLGRDRFSGLLEFAHLASGDVPSRGGDGQLRPTPSTGIVLVLIPSSTFLMGAQATDEGAPNYDPRAQRTEGAVHEVTLSPFLIAKHELTQGQWLRLTGTRPSSVVNQLMSHAIPFEVERDRLPVTNVSWLDARRVLGQFGLQLPTEAQWECAARAGGSEPWSHGATEEVASSLVNYADRSAIEVRAPFAHPSMADGRPGDGWILYAPVGSLPRNAWGLFETVGNVSEWCRDGYRDERYPPGYFVDPLETPGGAAATRVLRGGSFVRALEDCRVSSRLYGEEAGTLLAVGMRAALDLSP